ncbi:MAG: AraC family transcriptional regulator ligand-binding domain-containing protein [Lysobacterales bacterium]
MKQALRFTVARGWALLIRDMGLSPTTVLTLAGLPADLFARAEASLSAAQYFDLWRGLEQAAADQELPLLIARTLSVETFSPPIFACLCSANLNQALQRLSAFKRLIGPLTLSVELHRSHTRAEIGCYGHDGRLPRSLEATELVFLTQLARLATRQRIHPMSVQLTELPPDIQPYEHFFGTTPVLGATACVSFAADDARRPFLTEDTTMWRFFETNLRRRLSDVDATASISERIHAVLLAMLPAGLSSIEEAARRLAISPRSLQRLLQRESVNYQDVLNHTRRELAHHYLARSSMSLGEIAYLLGYRDGNSFTRAFKQWTGATPGAYRSTEQAGMPA